MLVLDTREIEALASMVSKVAPDESQLCQSALMWLAVNQMRRSDGQRTLAEICESLCALRRTGSESASPKLAPEDDGLAGLRKRARSVLMAQEADPTFGADRVHRHDDWPDWSQLVSPSALIGPFFFYSSARAEG